MEIYKNFEKRGDACFWLFSLKKNDQDVASAQVYIKYNPQRERFYSSIENIFVESKFRGRGLASRLIEEMMVFSKEQKLYKITLSCRDELIHLYKKHGFQKDENFMRLNL